MGKFYRREGVTIEVTDPYREASLEAQGFELVEAPAAPGKVAPKSEGEKPVDKMTVAELKAHAEKHEIELGEASVKADILAAVKAAAEAPAPAEADGQAEGTPATTEDLLGDAGDPDEAL